MEISKLLEDIEKLFYSFLTLIVLIPKTLFQLLVPRWSFAYVESQFELPTEDRFKDFTSPVLLFILFVTLPIYYSLNYGTYLGPLNTNRTDFFSSVATNPTIPFIDKFLIISVIFSIYPILFSLLILILKKEAVTTDSLKKYIYHFLYTFCISYASGFFLFTSFFLLNDYDIFILLFAIILFGYVLISTYLTNFSILTYSLHYSRLKTNLCLLSVYILVMILYYYIIGNIVLVLFANIVD
ncbi:hypothetical protein [Rubrolithibacter danxiaensis]|uniref:hypothetical protein n=1 Tax=Rubrolithibacter danxiaensis TaxID=3390805 RepID=UPI003BF8C39D